MFENLALEEWALSNLDTENCNYLILYINTPCVVLGRNQNLFEELNLLYCRENDIRIARRISGGGTVFHDEGNLNWTWISAFDEKKVNRYEWAAQAIIDLLSQYGLKAYLTDRNAIEVDGLKISGQAQFTNRKNILSHGTLLIDADLNALQPAIEMDERLQIDSKARPSVRSTTTNLNALRNSNDTPLDYGNALIRLVQGEAMDMSQVKPNVAKFKSATWIMERSPKFKATHQLDDEVFVFTVEKGRITKVEKKKDQLQADSPFLNQTYEKFLTTILD